ncbi:MAG: Octanoyltransferase [Verrucomicrobia bacterium ADurb.Bin345]|nr:MAG: Octanoyltransferase [Verrucomicrobia bacterium ADurb.Bin345]
MSAWAIHFSRPVPYARAVLIQERLLESRAADRIPDTILFLEHEPVITLGQRGRTRHLVATPDELAARGIAIVKASRGGDVTYHGPGQLVIYPILRLGEREADAHSYLHNLEELAIRTAADFEVSARRRKGMNGAWTDKGKIAAIGFRLKRWITMHGMSFNVCPDLEHFRLIVPCGLTGEAVSSLRDILGPRAPAVAAVYDRMARNFETIFHRPMDRFEADGPLPELLRPLLDTRS